MVDEVYFLNSKSQRQNSTIDYKSVLNITFNMVLLLSFNDDSNSHN